MSESNDMTNEELIKLIEIKVNTRLVSDGILDCQRQCFDLESHKSVAPGFVDEAIRQ